MNEYKMLCRVRLHSTSTVHNDNKQACNENIQSKIGSWYCYCIIIVDIYVFFTFYLFTVYIESF